MPVRSSSAREIQTLIADLSAASTMKRDAAVARLAIIGVRAVERLVAVVLSDAPAATRIAALRALEGIGGDHPLDATLKAVADRDPDVAIAAIGAARLFLTTPRGMAAIDRLTAVSVDCTRSDDVRVAAVRALRDLEPATLAPLWHTLAGDASAAIRDAARLMTARADAPPPLDPAATLMRAADHELPDDPAFLRRLILRGGSAAPLPALLRLVERAREREAANGVHGAEWAAARAAAHLVLARRRSRVALYDLRESLATQKAPLPVDALAALTLIGDASCLEPIALSYARSKDEWWRDHLRDAFGAIVSREGLTKRHAVVKVIDRKKPGLIAALWPPAPSTARGQPARRDG